MACYTDCLNRNSPEGSNEAAQYGYSQCKGGQVRTYLMGMENNLLHGKVVYIPSKCAQPE